jgi:hypothetical protein
LSVGQMILVPTNKRFARIRMPNGRPGDHPYTDIVVHGGNIFGQEIDDLVRSMSTHPQFATIRNRVVELLWSCPNWTSTAEERAELLSSLSQLREELGRS